MEVRTQVDLGSCWQLEKRKRRRRQVEFWYPSWLLFACAALLVQVCCHSLLVPFASPALVVKIAALVVKIAALSVVLEPAIDTSLRHDVDL